jgi:hypothetical protein
MNWLAIACQTALSSIPEKSPHRNRIIAEGRDNDIDREHCHHFNWLQKSLFIKWVHSHSRGTRGSKQFPHRQRVAQPRTAIDRRVISTTKRQTVAQQRQLVPSATLRQAECDQ